MFQEGKSAVSFTIAEQYIDAFSNLAKKGNTLILPSNTGDVSNMVAQVSHNHDIYTRYGSPNESHIYSEQFSIYI